jgi:hypothetical protein
MYIYILADGWTDAGRGDAKSDGVDGVCRESRWGSGEWKE